MGVAREPSALTHQAGIGAIKQDDRPRRIGPGQKRVDFFPAKRDHTYLKTLWADQVPAMKNDARR